MAIKIGLRRLTCCRAMCEETAVCRLKIEGDPFAGVIEPYCRTHGLKRVREMMAYYKRVGVPVKRGRT